MRTQENLRGGRGPAGRLRALGLEGQHWGWGACGCEWVPAGHIITSSRCRHRSTPHSSSVLSHPVTRPNRMGTWCTQATRPKARCLAQDSCPSTACLGGLWGRPGSQRGSAQPADIPVGQELGGWSATAAQGSVGVWCEAGAWGRPPGPLSPKESGPQFLPQYSKQGVPL